jgi:hypothetical protein
VTSDEANARASRQHADKQPDLDLRAEIEALRAELRERRDQREQHLAEIAEMDRSGNESERNFLRKWGPIRTNDGELSSARSIAGRFYGLRLDASDLSKLARMIHDFGSEYDLKVYFEVSTSNYRDRFHDSNPQFFESDDMPRVVGQILMTAGGWHSNMRCELIFDAAERPAAEFVVSGNDRKAVSGFAHDLERTIGQCKGPFSTLSGWINVSRGEPGSMSSRLVFGILGLSAAVSVFFLTGSVALAIQKTYSLSAQDVANSFGWVMFVAATLAFVIGGDSMLGALRKLAPTAAFVGRLSDRNSAWRWHFVWLASWVILPALIGVVVNLATK